LSTFQEAYIRNVDLKLVKDAATFQKFADDLYFLLSSLSFCSVEADVILEQVFDGGSNYLVGFCTICLIVVMIPFPATVAGARIVWVQYTHSYFY
jgi:hypothetical protein